MPYANIQIMNLYLRDFAKQLSPDVHALLVLDGAGWHQPQSLTIPDNVTLLLLPPYSPELNPPEMMWRELRQKQLSNREYPTEAKLWQAVESAWLAFGNDRAAVRSLCNFPWIASAINN